MRIRAKLACVLFVCGMATAALAQEVPGFYGPVNELKLRPSDVSDGIICCTLTEQSVEPASGKSDLIPAQMSETTPLPLSSTDAITKLGLVFVGFAIGLAIGLRFGLILGLATGGVQVPSTDPHLHRRTKRE